MSQFSARLSTLRHERGLTLAALGARSGLHPTAIGRLERGLRPTIEVIARLARALGVPASDLAAAAVADLDADPRVEAAR